MASSPSSTMASPESLPQEDTFTYNQTVENNTPELETNENYSHLSGSDLQPFTSTLLESNYIASLVVFIHKFIQTPINHKHSKKRILDSLSFHYPNTFCLKLANLLALNPPIHIANEAVLLLRETLKVTPRNHIHRIRCDILLELRSLILEHFKVEIQEKLLPLLTETIASLTYRIYAFPSGGWLELLEYIVSCVTLNSNDDGDSVLKQRKGLMLLADLPESIAEHRGFWKKRYDVLCENLLARMVDRNANENSQALGFDSLHMMLKIAQPLRGYKIGGSILLILLEFIDRHSNEEIVVKRVLGLRNFVSMDVDLVLSGKGGNVLQAMLRIVDKNGASKELRCAAVEVLKGLGKNRRSIMAAVMKELSDVDAQRVIKLSMDMMFESDTRCFELGKSLLNWLSFREGSFVFHMFMNFLKTTYAASKDLKKRHTIMIVIARFADGKISDDSVFATEIIKMITNEINNMISMIVERVKAEEAGTFEGGSEYLPDEDMILDNDFPDRVKVIAFSFFNIIGPFFPNEVQIYHDKYTCELLKAREANLHAQVEIARGIGICATYGGQKFKTIVNEAISRLYSLIEHEHSIKEEEEESSYGAYKSGMAVTALGMIYEFHWENIDGRPEFFIILNHNAVNQVIRSWLSFLPLTDHLNLAKYVHGRLSKMLKREEADVLGPNNENLPKIVSIVRAILLRRDELATEETSSEIIGFLDKYGGDMS
ncbi:PREDICTED: uncharacterized protein LOC109329273 [Lupinus angustifolius]|uniref:uncharacterized protein LOC109329273 n=1 Tax=Lupinus angustifolius TaxID=3871 RepID=UPI00092E221E|nr:PREDICTED: uncharacterized protein LOC109329273 [Lupinus angustifolius]